jgi:hypothetical protein
MSAGLELHRASRAGKEAVRQGTLGDGNDGEKEGSRGCENKVADERAPWKMEQLNLEVIKASRPVVTQGNR